MVAKGDVKGQSAVLEAERQNYFKLHPNQEKYPGGVISMPNLPNDQYHWGIWQKKGYKATIEALMPGKIVVWEPNWGMSRLVDTPSETSQANTPVKCPVCQKECNGNFGLQAHMRSHENQKS